MGFKDFLGKMKDSAASFAQTTARYNASGFCGNIDHGIKGADFAPGAFVNIQDGQGLIYGNNLEDYIFTAEDIVSFELRAGGPVKIRKGNDEFAVLNFMITFRDGKKAHADILVSKLDQFKLTFKL